MSTGAAASDPAYKAIANDLRTAILQNRYPKDHRLPTEDELARQYRVGRQTIRRAYQDLMAEGLIYRVRRRGTFAYPVSAPLANRFRYMDEITDLSGDDETEIVAPLSTLLADPVTAGLLEVADALVGALSVCRLHRGQIVYYAELRFPAKVTAYLESEPALRTAGHRGRFTILSLIDAGWGGTIIELSETVRPVAAPASVATKLGCRRGLPILQAEAVLRDRLGVPVELATTYYHPTNYVMHRRLHR